MNSNDVNFRKAFEDSLEEHGGIFQHNETEIYSIALKSKPDRIITARIIGSEQIDERIHGSKNDTAIKAIGYFKFEFSPEVIEPNFYIFAFNNIVDNNKVEFAVVPYTELKKRLASRKSFTVKDYWTELQFWLMPPEDYLFETTNIGAEGEFWFAGGRMSKHMQWDYTEFLNGWDRLITCT